VVIAFADKLDPTPRGPVVEIQQTTINVQSADQMVERINYLAAKHGMDVATLLNGSGPAQIEHKPVELPAEPPASSTTFKGW
jgi:hypothetical protein